ncbi:MAG: shikimate dehydrogenase [Hyphomicrobiales bacterium]|nr:shikimate dehydrogenase [Hyphomicrobiales bacterium]
MINGATRLLVIVGDPVAHVRSPLIFNPLLARMAHDAVLVPWHAPAPHFATVMEGLMRTANLDGIVVTFPFKERAQALAHRVGPMAKRVGAINALRREADGGWVGEMFDGFGLVRAIEANGERCAGRRVVLIGAGGAGSAIAFALADAGAASLTIHDRNGERAAALARRVGASPQRIELASGQFDLETADLLINATPVGLNPRDGLPVRIQRLRPEMTVIDIVPASSPTPLLKMAQAAGCPHVGGTAMVEGQAETILAFFGMAAARDDRLGRDEGLQGSLQ